MLKLCKLVLCFAASFVISSHDSVVGESNAKLYNTVKTILKLSNDYDINAGVYIKDLTNGSKFSYHGKRMFAPASVVKLFTTYAAINYLGPAYKFKTFLAADKSQLKGGVLYSNLIIKFSGDPSLTFKDLKGMFEKVEIKNIKGNVIIDGTIFDKNHSAPGGFTWDDSPFYYAAPKSAIVVNKNCSRAKMMPSQVGQKAQLMIEEPELLSIENNVLTVAPRQQECEFKSRYLGQNKYEVYGCMFQDMTSAVKLHFALQDNQLMIISYIKKIFEELQIKFSSKFIFEKGPHAADNVLLVHDSLPLNELLPEILAHSCNVFASALFKAMAAKYYARTADYEMGEDVLKHLLKQSGLRGQFIIKDGAGESHHNLVTPETVVELLEIIYKQDPAVREVFIKALAQYKSDSSLSTRTLGRLYDKYIYAKTGSSKAVSAIAGYYLPSSVHKYAFVIMINNHNLSREKVKSLEDKILRAALDSFAQAKIKN